jgi:hypothetical protein
MPLINTTFYASGKQNFLVPENNTNSFDNDLINNSAIFSEEGVASGFHIAQTTSPSNQVQIKFSTSLASKNGKVGTVVVKTPSNEFLVLALRSATALNVDIPENLTAFTRYDLICVYADFRTAAANNFSIKYFSGDTVTDPDLDAWNAANSGQILLPIARIAKTPGSLVDSSQIILSGQTTYNVDKSVRATAKYLAGTIETISRAEFLVSTITENKIVNVYNPDNSLSELSFNDPNFGFKGIKTNNNLYYQLTSPLALGTYSASSSTTTPVSGVFNRVPRVSPASIFNDILTGATGVGSLTIPADTLKVGDVIDFYFVYDITFSTLTTGNAPIHYVNNLVKINGNYLSLSGNNIRTFYNTLSTAGVPGFDMILISVAPGGNITSPLPLKIKFKRSLKVIKTGVNGLLEVISETENTYSFATVSTNNAWRITKSAGSGYITNDLGLADIDTTIANTFNVDFGVYRSTTGANNFNPTFTLSHFIMSKN